MMNTDGYIHTGRPPESHVLSPTPASNSKKTNRSSCFLRPSLLRSFDRSRWCGVSVIEEEAAAAVMGLVGVMETQKSFSVNQSTRLLVFSFTLFSALLFLFLLLPSVFTYAPSSTSPDAHLRMPPPPSPQPADFTASFPGSPVVIAAKNSILALAQSTRNASGARAPVFSGKRKRPSSALEDARGSASANESVVRPGEMLGGVAVTGVEKGPAFTPAEDALVVKEAGAHADASGCDVSRGSWVWDESYPLYSNRTCSFIDEGFDCQTNGRVDKDYMKWRWQPHGCNIPRFNATKFLELIRGKRLVFAGDSLNRNQWESMLCLLRGGAKGPKQLRESHGRKISKQKGNYNFKFVDYQCSLEYYVTHFLVHEGKARVGRKRVQTLRIDTIDKSSTRWKGADILVFNTAHWWTHSKTKAGINYYQEGEEVHHHLDASVAFRRALTTWATWVDRHINPSKTQVYFRSSSPSHFSGGQWNSGGHCREATRPLDNELHSKNPEKNAIAEEVIKEMKTPVTVLNVTSLSGFRIDAHPSVYGRIPGEVIPSGIEDCSHWCLPGVPDAWNELLYFHLLSRHAPV